MAEWRVASDGETLAWQRCGWASRASGALALADPEPETLSRALGQTLEGRARAGDRLRIALGSRYVRVAALPWPRQHLSRSERLALLRQRWQTRLDDIDGWWLGIEAAGEMRLATAMPHALLRTLEREASLRGVRTRNCLPAAALVLRRMGGRGDCRLVIAEGARETSVTLSQGRLASLSSRWRAAQQSTESPPCGAGELRVDGGPQGWLEWF